MKQPSSKPPDRDDLGLTGFEATPSDDGITLDDLSESFARLIGGGADPYVQPESAEAQEKTTDSAPDDEDVSGPSHLESDDDDDCPVTPRSILEAMLFVGHPQNEPLTSKQVSDLMRGVRPEEIDELVCELNAAYEEEGCPYFISSVGSGYRMILREQFESLRENFYRRVKETHLSQAAIDVLAIVAYHQPVGRQRIDDLRETPSGPILGQLVRRKLLQVERQPDDQRTLLYRTTDRFLAIFGLESVDELPRSPDAEIGDL